jgi:hypothetical protein
MQYWVDKGDARIDYLFGKCDKRIDNLFSRNDARLEFLEKHAEDNYAIRDVWLDHVFSESQAKRETKFATRTVKFENLMAERNSEVEKSSEKTDPAFAERHANIESVFAECEIMIDLLFTEVERTATHSAIPFNISAFNPISVQTDLVCSFVPSGSTLSTSCYRKKV